MSLFPSLLARTLKNKERARTQTRMHTHTLTHIHSCTHRLTYTHKHSQTLTYIRKHSHTITCTYIRTHSHTLKNKFTQAIMQTHIGTVSTVLMTTVTPFWLVCFPAHSLLTLFCANAQSMAPLGLGFEQMAMRLLGLHARGGVTSGEGAARGGSRSGKPLWMKIGRSIVSVAVRTLLALFALAIVTAIPSFGLFMGVIGATCSFSLAVTLPSLYYVRLFWGSLTPAKRVAHCALVVFGLLSSVMGTYASIQRHAHASTHER